MLHIVLSHFVGRLSLAGRAAQGICFTNIAPLKFIQSNPLTVKSRHRIDLQFKVISIIIQWLFGSQTKKGT